MNRQISRRTFAFLIFVVDLSIVGIMLAFITSMAGAARQPEQMMPVEGSSAVLLPEDLSPYEAPSGLLMQEEVPLYEVPSTAAGESSWSIIIENVGQFDPQARFMMRLDGGFLWLADDGFWVTAFDDQAFGPAEEAWRIQGVVDWPISAVNVKLSFVGAASADIEPFNRQDTNVSYITGSDASQWRSNVPVWGGVRYRDLYPDIDLVVGQDSSTGSNLGIPWHLEMRPDAGLDRVQLLVEGADGVSVSGDDLVLATAAGDLAIPLLATDYQTAPDASVQQLGEQRFVVTAPVVSGGEPESVEPDDLNDATDLNDTTGVNDATDLVYSTYLGGSEWENGSGIDVDDAGMVYVAGSTPSADFPTTPGAFKTTLSFLDAYVVKLDPAGNGSSDLIYATFLGGYDQTVDYADDLTVVNGEAYVSGKTDSSSFPTTPGAFDTTCGNDGDCDGFDDAFFALLSSDGSSLLYSTYLGGKNQERATSIDVSGGEVYLAGYTKSADFPTTSNAFDRECGTDGVCNKSGNIPTSDAFFVKLAPDGNGIIDQLYGTFLGGYDRDEANGIDASGGDAFISGWSASADFPASGYAGGRDAFAVRLDPVGGGSSDQIYGTFLGGSGWDNGNGVAVIGDQAFVIGETRSANFPVIDSSSTISGSSDVFLSQLDGSGAILYSAFIGGSGEDIGYDAAVEDSGAVVLTGLTNSDDFPVTAEAYDGTFNGETDIFVARINLDSFKPQHITYASYLGGSGDYFSDEGRAVAVDAEGHAYLTGSTQSVDFPTTTGAFDTTLAGSKDSFVAKMIVTLPPAINIEKSTNGFDADEPPGQYLPTGTPITWQYVIINSGDSNIDSVTVSDDQLGPICVVGTLISGQSASCLSNSSTAQEGQYANLGTVTGQPVGDFDPVNDTDTSHYFGSVPDIIMEKQTNGEDADTGIGPLIRVGDTVTWTFGITNTGNVPLSSIVVTDDPQGAADCPFEGLAANQSMTCIITSTAGIGPYSNVGYVTADPPPPLAAVTYSDPSHYFGADPSLAIQKSTMDQDADEMPGPLIPEGKAVSWTYAVTNTGNITLTTVTVSDDQGVKVSCPRTGLDINESMICTANGVALSGQYTNSGVVTGTIAVGPPVLASDISHYFGTSPLVAIEKRTNDLDADVAPGPFILAGDPVTWTYIVTNTGNITLSAITVEDDQLGTISCDESELAVDESMTCTANGVALPDQYANRGIVTGTPPVGLSVSNIDFSHYFGASPDVLIEKRTVGRDADSEPGPYLAVNDIVTWTYEITNTGNITLTSLSVVDDQDVTVDCPDSPLSVDASMICTATGVVISGQYSNTGTVLAAPPVGPIITDDDVSHYFGSSAAVAIEKRTNGEDADTSPGPLVLVDSTVTWTYVVSNTGDVPLSDVTVSDSDGSLGITCDGTTLAVGESFECEATGTAGEDQYSNLGTVVAKPPDDLPTVTDDDPSHYFGAVTQIGIEKSTNGEDADVAPGPIIIYEHAVNWTYVVTNEGNVDLTNIIVIDDQGVSVGCPSSSLDVGASMTCDASGTAGKGQYSNVGEVTADPPAPLAAVEDNDPSHYFGADPSLAIQKSTMDQDADEMPGPLIPEGKPVSWTYAVTNTGNITLTTVTVFDDQGVEVSCPETTLGIGIGMICSASGVALSGQYTNTGVVTGTIAVGPPILASDISHYFGTSPDVAIEKRTNDLDADAAPGPFILVGDPVTWTYIITNTGNIDLSAITVVDVPLGSITCPATILAVDESMTCTVNGFATSGQYANTGTVTGTPPVGQDVTASDTSHYFGAAPDVLIEKRTVDRDADSEPGPYLAVDDIVTWTYEITNTGNITLSAISLVDDQIGSVSCPESTLPVGASMICTDTGVVSSGQYSNTGTVSAAPPVGPIISDDDVSHYFGSSPAVAIEKRTNGEDADTSLAGPWILVGSTVTWTYVVSNTGDVPLSNITVSDSDPLVVITCLETTLEVGESFECEATGTAEEGEYSNVGKVVAKPPDDLPTVTDDDPSHYFGAVTKIGIEKATNGEDADVAPGAIIIAGHDVNWTYVVSNEGNVDLSNIIVTDDQGVSPDCGVISGLAVGDSMTCHASGKAGTGQYSNVGTADASIANGLPDVSDSDPSHYLGVNPAIAIKKLTNGQDSAEPTGLYIKTGDLVTWSYVITNTGDITLTNVTASDDQGVTVICPEDVLDVGESMSCAAYGTATAGAYSNVGKISAQPINNSTVISATDTSYYFGAELNLVLEKSTEGEDADEAPGPYIPEGETVNWSFHVVNSGNVTVTEVVVIDNLEGEICTTDTLIPGEEMTCLLSDTANAGQYANSAQVTGTPPGGLAPFSGSDSSHYFGTVPGIAIEKRTNGETADSAPGPYIPVGQSVSWTYEITNSGNITLTSVAVLDDQGVVVSCPKSSLGPDEVIICTGGGTSQAGPYANKGTVTGTPPVGPNVSAEDSSHYFGSDPSIVIEKFTNGQAADSLPGPYIVATLPVTWTYGITNTGNVTLTSVIVTDDDPDVSPDCPWDELAADQSMTCTAVGVAKAGQYSNEGSVSGTPPAGADVDGIDTSHYTGLIAEPAIVVEKRTNGQKVDSPPGPFIQAGEVVSWTYIIANIGNVPLESISIVDSDSELSVWCPKNTLETAETMTCSAEGDAQAGQYSNTGSVTALPPDGVEVSANSTSYYFGSAPAVILEKSTNGFDADTVPGPFILIGDPVTWTYHITNTGNVTLTEIIVSDDQGVEVTCPDDELIPSAFMTCSGEGESEFGQYANTGIITGTPPVGLPVIASDISHYLGSDPQIQLEKLTNGEDADGAPGPYIIIGEEVNWTYEVTNTGNITLTNVIVDDDKGVVVTCPKDTLNPGEMMTCTGSDVATAGEYSNVGLATTLNFVSDKDPSHYFGRLPDIMILKQTNGHDAKEAPGPYLEVGVPVTWTYLVTNTGLVTLENISVTDSEGLTVSCPKSVLEVGEGMSCSANGFAVAGQYSNIGFVEGRKSDNGDLVTAEDDSHYFGGSRIFLPVIIKSGASWASGGISY